MSEIPADLFGTYQQYKAKNQHVSDWLLQNSDKEVKPARLKRTRKRTKGDQLGPTTLRPCEYLPLVRHMAGRKPPIEIPSSFIRNLRSLIRQRKAFYTWFSSLGSSDSDLVEENERHLHFIRILQRVAQLLTPLQKTERENENAKPVLPSTLDKNAISTSFQALSLQKPVQNADEDIAKSDNVQDVVDGQVEGVLDDGWAFDPTAEDESRPQKMSYKRIFAFRCLLQDLQSIRQLVKARWLNLDRRNGSDIMEAAILANTAVDLAVRLEADFRRAFCVGDTDDFRQLFVDPSNPTLSSLEMVEKVGKDFKLDGDDNGELIYWGFVAEGFVRRKVQDIQSFEAAQAQKRKKRNARRAEKRREKNPITSDTPAQDSQLDVRNDVPALDASLQNEHVGGFNDPRSLADLQGHIAELHEHFDIVLDFRSKNGSTLSFVEDEILRRLRVAIAQNLVTLSTAFAVQVHFDIQFVAGDYAKLFQRLDKVADSLIRWVDAVHQKLENWDGDSPSAQSDSPTYESHQRMTDFAKGWLSGQQTVGSCVPIARGFRQYVRCSPLAAALVLFWLNLSEVKSMVDFVDHGMLTMAMLHFYHLAKQNGEVPMEWPDVERLIEIHGEEHVFLGKRPVGVHDCYGRFRAIFGLPADPPLGKPRREQQERDVFEARRRRCRGLLWKGFCPVSKLISARLESSDPGAVDFSADDIELALLGIHHGQRYIVQQGNDSRLSNRSSLWNKMRRSDRMKPLDLLKSLEARLEVEIEHSRFNYIFFEAQIQVVAKASADALRAEGTSIWEEPDAFGMVGAAGDDSETVNSGIIASAIIKYGRNQDALEEARRLDRNGRLGTERKKELQRLLESKDRRFQTVVQQMNEFIRESIHMWKDNPARSDRWWLLDQRRDETPEQEKARVRGILADMKDPAKMDSLPRVKPAVMAFMERWANSG